MLQRSIRHFLRRPYFMFSNEPKKPEQTGGLDQKDSNEQLKQAIENENEEQGSKSSNMYIYAFGSLGLIVCYAFMQVTTLNFDNKSKKKELKVSYTGKAQIGGPWKLLTTDGQSMTHLDLKGSYYLIYFGFCNCPDICPASLLKLSKALERIRQSPEGKIIKLKTLFVSVDPDRDSDEKINKFLAHFDKSIIGLKGATNDDPDLKEAMKQFKIYASKIKFEEQDSTTKSPKNSYTIDHTIITYLMDDENNYVTHLGSNMSEFDLARNIVDKILENEREKLRR